MLTRLSIVLLCNHRHKKGNSMKGEKFEYKVRKGEFGFALWLICPQDNAEYRVAQGKDVNALWSMVRDFDGYWTKFYASEHAQKPCDERKQALV
jgi:predicted aminopeptidase